MNIRVCPDCKGRQGRTRNPDERQVLRMRMGMDKRSTETPYYYETLPEFKPCPLCQGSGEVVCEAAEAKERNRDT